MASFARKAIVPAPLVVQGRIGPLSSLLDPTRGQQVLDRPIQGTWCDTHSTVGLICGFLHNCVTVAFAPGEGQEDVKHC